MDKIFNAMDKHYIKFAIVWGAIWLTILGIALNARGTVYFVDIATGSDSNSGLDISHPWAHAPGSVGISTGSGWPAHIVNGDTIVYKGGSVNTVKLYLSGVSTTDAPAFYTGSLAFNSILIQSGDLYSPQWGTTPAIFEEAFTRTYGIGFETVNGVTFDGFEVRNIAPCGSCAIDGAGSACIEIAGADYFWIIKRCWLHDAYRPYTSGDDNGHGIEGGQPGIMNFQVYWNNFGPNIGTKGIEMFRFMDGVVSNNFFTGCGDHSICFGLTTNVDVCNNLVYQDYSTGTNGPVHTSIGGITMSSALFCDVFNNIVVARTRNFSSTPFSSGSIVALSSYELTISNRIFYNTFAFSGSMGNDGPESPIMLQKQIGDYADANSYTLFQNNIAYKNANQDGNIQFCVVHPSYVDHENVQYNCFWGGVSTTENVMAYRPEGSSGSDTVSPLSTYNPPTTSHTYANNSQIDPVVTGGAIPTGLDAFHHPNQNYFALTAGSPNAVRVTGNNVQGGGGYGWDQSVNKFKLDIVGNTRTIYSMGAYEAGSSSDPAITQQPNNQTVVNGGTATFTIAATGTPTLSYQWKKNGSNVGTSSPTYSFVVACADNGATFQCVVTGPGPNSPQTSSTATLTVTGCGGGGGGGTGLSATVGTATANSLRSPP